MTSLITLDLGGKNTGFFSFTAKDVSRIDAFQSGTIIYDESFVLSQVARRGKRHGKRNNLRNTLVKRLFLLLLQKHYGLNLDFLPDEILGLFNKRGYTYASFDESKLDREKLESDALREILEERFGTITQDSIERFLTDFASSEASFKKFYADFKQFKEEVLKEKQPQDIKSGLKIIEDILNDHDKQQNQGNLPRAKYFEELNLEIEHNPKIQKFFTCNHLHIHDMQHLIGNLSNYQLKELRRYFNDEAMAKEDFWTPQKLHHITWRFIQSWHPKSPQDKERQKENLAQLKNKNIVEFLTTTNPLQTIPPYDDMNNRGAVKCQTLRLNEAYLDKKLPNWRAITHALASEAQKENLESSTVKGYSEDSTLLHRILDTSKEIDKYELRAEIPSSLLQKTLGSDTEKFHSFAKNYYELIKDKVRTGIWAEAKDKNGKLILDDESNMVKICGKNPPHKSKQLHNLVSGVLGFEISEDKLGFNDKKKDEKNFNETLWNPKSGKKLKTYCEKIEKARKSVGNRFKKLSEIILELEDEKLDDKDKKFKKTIQALNKELPLVIKTLQDFFRLDDHQIKWFNNLFSLAQLYTILETQRKGFNKTCQWCTVENRYRSTVKTHNEITGEVYKKLTANCQRLPADTQRPFSGKIGKYINKLGYEIAKIKARELQNSEDKEINLKIILEQNSFAYEESVSGADNKSIKKVAKKSDRDELKSELKKSYDRIDKDTNEKNERIRQFNKICPYSGLDIGNNSEIDHILSRSETLNNFGTVFNGEGNLINAHIQGNQNKGKDRKKLSEIHPRYKQEIFNTTDNNQIIDFIDREIKGIKRYKTFTLLTNSQQKAFKNALFLFEERPDIYEKVERWLQTDQSSRVNGTQKYLAKKIQEKLKAMLPHKTFKFEFILADANDVHDLRIKAYKLPEKPKDSKQETYSHAIDAVMSLVSVWDKVLPKTEKPTKEDVLKFANVKNWSALNNEFLTKGKSANQKIEEMIQANDFGQKNMRQVFSKPIFGENALGERYKPIIKFNEQYFIGYPIKTKDGYDLNKCKIMKTKNKIRLLKAITSIKKLVLKQEKQQIIICEINKQRFNEMSNQYFNISYKDLNYIGKTKANLLEFIAQNCKYYTKKVNVKFAPSYKKEIEEMKYPFYNEWKLFDEAWKYLKINENKKDFRNRYLIDKKQINQSYQIDTKKSEYKLDGDITPLWEDFCRWYFLDRFKKDEDIKKDNQKVRIKARKEFSLVAVGTAQGKVFRAKRTTPKGFVYQALPMDNKIIAGDYANVLLEGNSKTLSLIPKSNEKIEKQLLKPLSTKEIQDIRNIELEASKFFKEGFDCGGIEVILNKTSATIKNFPIDNLMQYLQGSEKRYALLYKYGLKRKKSKDKTREKPKSTIDFAKNSDGFGVIKTKLYAILKMTTKSDGTISKIIINNKYIDFTLPYKNTAKLLDD